MNDIFKKYGNKIELDKNYFLQPDQFKGLILVFQEERERKKTDSKTRKETGEVENYIFEEKWYYPKLSQTLEKYIKLTLNESVNLIELYNRVQTLEAKINTL